MPIRIVTDSNCDLPAELIERHRILVVPSVLNMDGRAYRDGVDISRAEFYRRLPTSQPVPTTAAPASGEFEAAYRACGDADIISIHVASKLSGILNAARLGAEAVGERVHLVDSGQVSMGQGWQVLAAAEAAAAGQSTAQVRAAAESTRRRCQVLAVLDTLEYLRRGGRASALSAILGELLQVKPLLELVDGDIVLRAKLRTWATARGQLVKLVEALGRLERLAVLHTDRAAEARALADRLAPRAASEPLVVEATAVIGTHVGPGAVGVAAVKA